MNEDLKITPEGIDLIKTYEGCVLHAYRDAVGVWTIGYGTTMLPDGTPVHSGMLIDQDTAEQYLEHDLIKFENIVKDAVTVELNENQFSALVSFTYNLGGGNLRSSTLLRKLNNGDYAGASAQFPRWNRAGGRVLDGLTARRNAEMTLFNTPIEDAGTSDTQS